MISLYSRKTETDLTIRKKESMDKYVDLIQWGRRNPTKFIEEIFGIQLIDFQKNLILGTWTSNRAVWCAARNSGKSFLVAIYAMLRALLLPNCTIYIVSNSADQAQATFNKICKLCRGEEQSVQTDPCMFYNELVKSNANTDGFIKKQGNYSLTLFNGSTIQTLAANPDTARGRRANVVIFDEAAYVSDVMYQACLPFINQDPNFKTGKGFNSKVHPKTFNNQIIMCSSAGSVNTECYRAYRQCIINSIIGYPGYYAADINCEMTLHPYINGKPVPAIANKAEMEMIRDTDIRKYNTEFMNLWTDMESPDSLLQRSVIIRNEKKYLPETASTDKTKKYVICWDPAVQHDNSIVLVGEIFRDEKVGLKGRLVNCFNLIEPAKQNGGDRQPLRMPDQITWVRKFLRDYNNAENHEYTNVTLRMDSGSGAGGKSIPDYLMASYTDENGVRHVGVYDSKFNPDVDDVGTSYQNMHRDKFPEAVDCLQAVDPRKYRTEMFGALTSMITQDYIEFPPSLPSRGEIENEDGSVYKLSLEETRALLEFDLLKDEAVRMQQTKLTTGEVKYAMPSGKDHDDRVYCLALFASYLANMRQAENRASENNNTSEFADYIMSRIREGDGKKTQNPFAGKSNPFAGKKW